MGLLKDGTFLISMTTNKKIKRLKSRKYDGISYVLFEDIQKLHGKRWTEKYEKVAGPGNTCVVVPANDKSHNLPSDQIGIYMWDYERFANCVDFNKPTYWD